MSLNQKYTILLTLIIFSVSASAKPPNQQQTAAALPQVHSVIVDYSNSEVLVKGLNLDTASVTATLAGVDITNDLDSISDTQLNVLFSSTLSTIVDKPGNYVLSITTNDGNFTLSAFIPFPLVYIPPSGDPCPCKGEWDLYRTQASPDGFSGLTPYCQQDNGSDYVTVHFWDTSVNNYWLLRTSWNGSSGYCELYIDAPPRILDSQAQFDACADYLRQTFIQVYPNVGGDCLL